jgi:hypothetical protein
MTVFADTFALIAWLNPRDERACGRTIHLARRGHTKLCLSREGVATLFTVAAHRFSSLRRMAYHTRASDFAASENHKKPADFVSPLTACLRLAI